jgi:restriction system protein
MPTEEPTIWGIHAGKTGDADTIFLKKHRIAVGWADLGDPRLIAPNREALKLKVAEAFIDMKPGAVPVSAGQIYRFVHEMKPGDVIIYPSKGDRQVHLGVVEGEYEYSPETAPGYPNQRAVKWVKSLPRTKFTQGALYEIGAATSLFQVKNYAHEFLAALEGKIERGRDLADGRRGHRAEHARFHRQAAIPGAQGPSSLRLHCQSARNDGLSYPCRPGGTGRRG